MIHKLELKSGTTTLEYGRRAEKKEEKIYLGQEEEEEEGLLRKTFKPEEKRIKKIDWAFYFSLLSSAKYIFESLLFLAMVIFYILVHLNSQEFVMSQQITNSFMEQFRLDRTKLHPEASMMDFIIKSSMCMYLTIQYQVTKNQGSPIKYSQLWHLRKEYLYKVWLNQNHLRIV